MKTIPKIILIGLVGGLILAVGSWIKDRAEPVGDLVPQKLKVSVDKILDVKEVDDIRCSVGGLIDTGTTTINDYSCVNLGKIKKYLYISNKEILPEEGEAVNKRTTNAKFFQKSSTEWTGKFYNGNPFFKDEIQNKWFFTEIATTTIDAWNAQMKFSGMLFGTIETFYSGSGDGAIANYNGGDWPTTHSALTGNYVSFTNTTFCEGVMCVGVIRHPSGNYSISRGFAPVDTSSLPDDAVTASSSLYLYCIAGCKDVCNTGSKSYSIIQTTNTSTTSLATADYDLCGAVNSPDEGSSQISMDAMTASSYVQFALNATGRGWITNTSTTQFGFRQTTDYSNTDPGWTANTSCFIQMSTSEETGTTQDPYLLIDYTTGEGEVAPLIESDLIIFE